MHCTLNHTGINFDHVIEFVLRHPAEIAKQIDYKRQETTGGGHTGGGSSNHSYVSDPTALQAIRQVEPVHVIQVPYGATVAGKRESYTLHAPEKWLIVESATRQHYLHSGNHTVVEIYRRRYQIGGEYGEPWRVSCAQLAISRGYYYTVQRDIIRYAGLYAAGIGIIPPYSRF